MAVHLRLRWFAIMGRNPRLSKCAIRPAKNYPARLRDDFRGPFGPDFSLPVNSLTSRIARFLYTIEARNLQPHDWGAIFLADETT